MHSSRKRSQFNEINITPLTDIFLVLLIIMMVVAPMLDTQGLKLAVPSAGAADSQSQPKTLTLSIAADDHYQLEQEMLSASSLSYALRSKKAQAPDGLLIQVAPQASHNALAQALNSAQEAGFGKIAVAAATTP